MTSSRKRALTWALVAVGIVIVGLGVALAVTFPWQQVGPWAAAAAGAPQAGAQAGPGPQAGVPPAGYPAWFGHPYGWGHGWGYWHGPRFFGGGLLVIALIIFLVSRFAWRRRYWGSWRDYRRGDDPADAEEILRRSFAEGRITEEEFKSRRDALRK